MENASKALLIAGAVLIVIVLISIGVLLISRTQNTTLNSAESTANVLADTSNQGVEAINNVAATLFNDTH